MLTEFDLPKCRDCRNCIPLLGGEGRSKIRKRAKGLCTNPDIPLEEVFITLSPALNLQIKDWTNRADQLLNGNFVCFAPQIDIPNKSRKAIRLRLVYSAPF